MTDQSESSGFKPNPTRGAIFALSCYFVWGIVPLFWKHFKSVPADEILAHRIIWSFFFLVIVVTVRKEWPEFFSVIKSRKNIRTFALTSLLISTNWLVFIWASNNNHIVECSLGYFINPLFNVFLGSFVLKEKLRFWQWMSISLAGIGVVFMTIMTSGFPWIALTLAATFALYGLLRKTASVEAVTGMTLETGFLIIPAATYLIFGHFQGRSFFGGLNPSDSAMLISGGALTALPLIWFAVAARNLKLSTLGFFQYLSPTCQLILAIVIYNEPFQFVHMVAFGFIWLALATFTVESQIHRHSFLKHNNSV